MKIGDYVKIKEDLQEIQYDGTWCNDEMTRMGGIVTKISEVISSNKYHLEHGCGWYWTESMLLPATEEEYSDAKKNRPEVGDIVLSNGQVGVYTGSSILKDNGVEASISHAAKIIKKFAPFKKGDFVRIRKTDVSIYFKGGHHRFISPTPYGIVDATIGDFTYILGCGRLPNFLVEQADIDLETFYKQYLYKDIVVYENIDRLKVEKVKKVGDCITTESDKEIYFGQICKPMIKKVRLTTDVFPYGKAGDIIEGHCCNSSILIPSVLPFDGVLYTAEYTEEE